MLKKILLLLFLSSWIGVPAHAALRVVASVPDLAALARELGGQDVTVSTLAAPGQDPHFVDAKPSLALDLSRADLLLVVGLDLEVGWLPVLQSGSRNPRVQRGAGGYLDCSQLVKVLEIPSGVVDRSMGDIHPGGNPHFLYDPRLGLLVARGIADRMASLDPANASSYRVRLTTFESSLQGAISRWEQAAAPLREVPVITYHRSLVYLVDWLGLRVVGELEPKPGIPPTPAHVAEVVRDGVAGGARMVIQESYYPSSLSRPVAERAGASLVVLPGGADLGSGQTYSQRVGVTVDRLIAGAGR